MTTLEGRLEGLGSYKNVLKIQEEKGGRGPLGPSRKSAYDEHSSVEFTRIHPSPIEL